MNIAEHVAVDQKIPVVIFELELDAKMLVLRLLCSRARVDFHNTQHGFIRKGNIENLAIVADAFIQSKLTIDDRGRPTIMELENRVKFLMADHRIGLIVIDTFESLGSARRLPPDQRAEEMSVIAHGLRALARESKVPILVVARLSRDADYRENQVPILADLSESGSLDQEADLVGLLYRVAYHDEDEKGKAESGVEKVELIIAKNSNGPLGSVSLTFQS